MNVTTTHDDDDDMSAEVDFKGAMRGKFYRPNMRLNLPVYLDADVQDYLSAIAAKKGMPLSQLANDLLKREIGIIEAVK
ncbi:hypothetical protein [Sulfuriferula sp.]|uniref:hypothetical protein n=1 Tax=Sulfuriferula sp. TaxID=2025307 RepID=UPI002730C5AE|nr:hypothetical protein [Sulfuriferula sp.]MDP2024766.1 hypothetical protein [Sulfuriferula sp.]